MLTFGGASSAGIYHVAAKLVKEFAVRASSTDDRMINQILDDVISVGSARDCTVGKFCQSSSQGQELGLSKTELGTSTSTSMGTGTGEV